MKPYLDLMQQVLIMGAWQENRTGIRTKMLPGAMLKFDLRHGFPAVTTKRLAFNQVKGELLGFLRGYSSVKAFNGLGCNVWDANAKAPAWQNSLSNDMPDGDYLGRIYGVQWRSWRTSGHFVNGQHQTLNQIEKLISTIKTDPTSRRMVVTAWRPDELDQMCLPPCHYAFQVIIEQETKTMHLLWNQRSCDLFLGVPFNIASYALLLTILARLTGYIPGTLTGFLADVHLYENHLAQVQEQLSRTPKRLPGLTVLFDRTASIGLIRPNEIILTGYECHPAIQADMAV